MAYYQYLKQYTPAFLRQYQVGQYAHLQRSSRYADIVDMNSCASLEIDEDTSFSYKAPYRLTNILAFVGLMIWWQQHTSCYQANMLKNRTRSFHNYKMWTRLELAIRSNEVLRAAKWNAEILDEYCEYYGITKDQLQSLFKAVRNDATPEEAFASLGLRFDKNLNKCVPLEWSRKLIEAQIPV